MAIVAVTSLKGGVGKTTTAIHLAHGLAKAGYQTLLIDCDVASNASRFFNIIRAADQPGILDLFCPREQLGHVETRNETRFRAVPRDAFVFNVRQNLDLVPGNRSLRLRMADAGATPLMAEKYLAEVTKLLGESYTFIVLDTSPELNLLTAAALRAAELMVVPVDSGAMSIEALEDLFEYIRAERIDAQTLVLRTMLDRRAGRTTSLCDDALSEYLTTRRGRMAGRTGYALELEAGMLETAIHRSELVNQLTYHRKTAFDLVGANPVAEDYRELVEEIIYLVALRQRQGQTRKAEILPLTNRKQDLRRAG